MIQPTIDVLAPVIGVNRLPIRVVARLWPQGVQISARAVDRCDRDEDARASPVAPVGPGSHDRDLNEPQEIAHEVRADLDGLGTIPGDDGTTAREDSALQLKFVAGLADPEAVVAHERENDAESPDSE